MRVDIECKHCDYRWQTESIMNQVTCPNCGKKTPKEIKDE